MRSIEEIYQEYIDRTPGFLNGVEIFEAGWRHRELQAEALSTTCRKPFFSVEISKDGCDHCGGGRLWCVVEPNGDTISDGHETYEDAQFFAEVASIGFERGIEFGLLSRQNSGRISTNKKSGLAREGFWHNSEDKAERAGMADQTLERDVSAEAARTTGGQALREDEGVIVTGSGSGGSGGGSGSSGGFNIVYKPSENGIGGTDSAGTETDSTMDSD